MLFHERQLLDPGVEAENVAGMLVDQEDEHAGIDCVVVEDQVVGVLDERPIQMRHPIDHHQGDAACRADAQRGLARTGATA